MEEVSRTTGIASHAYIATDALAKLVVRLVARSGDRVDDAHLGKAAYYESMLSLILLTLNHHHVSRGERFSQGVFFRLFSTMLHEFNLAAEQFTENEQTQMYLMFADALLKLQPARYPGFAFAWLSLLSHREFMPVLLRLETPQAQELLLQLIDRKSACRERVF